MRTLLLLTALLFTLSACLLAKQEPTATIDPGMSGSALEITAEAVEQPFNGDSRTPVGSSKLSAQLPAVKTPLETAVIEIPLAGDVADRRSELSGLAWYGDWLILLPQYPDFPEKKENGRLFALPRADIVAYLDGKLEGPLEPREIPFVAPEVWLTISGYEGFEAIAFEGDQAFLTIEASPSWGMIGYLVKGEMAPDLSELVLDTSLYVPLPSASHQNNKADEALLIAGDQVLSIHEANGVAVNKAPVARRFDQDLESLGSLPFPHIEYRITDVTDLDADGRFWAINYFFPGELALRAASDPIAEKYGEARSHAAADGVARLLELQLGESGITLVDRPPVQLELQPLALNNWEGIARLDDRGFLLVTDKFRSTILGFVPFP